MTRSLFSAGPISAFALNAARLSIFSGILFLFFLGSLHLLEPEFDPTWRFVSEYMLGRFGWMMSLAFAALAISLAGIGVAIFSHVRNVVGYIGLLILALAVIGMLIAAVFETDPISTKMDDLTPSGQLHVLGASMDYSPLAFLLLALSLVRHPEWAPLKKWLFPTAGITIALTIAFIATIPADGAFGPGVYSGLIGRFLLLSYLGWIGIAANRVLHLSKP
jgi:hypothetical protein